MSASTRAVVTSELFGGVALAGSHRSSALQVFGLRRDSDSLLKYRTLDEALAEGLLEITEVSESGSVPRLKLLNRSGERVFLMAGEQLVGAKQNRILNTSILVEARAEILIPVSCVEQGRWGYRSRSFGSSGTTSHSKLRSKLTGSVSTSFCMTGAPTSDQGEVWREVSRKLTAMDSMSDTAALEKAYEDTRSRIDEILTGLPAPEGCSGAVFVVGGRVAGLDLFDQPETLCKLWPKLARGYAIDALETREDGPAGVSDAEVSAWLERAAGLEAKSFKSPGLGDDVRLIGESRFGAGLVVEERPVHVQVFDGAAS